jgi:hypothetical protein
MKNIWFIPQYEYLNAPIIIPLIEKLAPKYDVSLVHLPDYQLTPGIYPPSANVLKVNAYSFRFLSEPFIRTIPLSEVVSRFVRFFRVTQDHFSHLKSMFDDHLPSVIVLPSDAGGNWDLFTLLSIAAYYRIPVIIVFPTDISEFSVRKSHRSTITLNNLLNRAGHLSLQISRITSMAYKIGILLRYHVIPFRLRRYFIADIPGCNAATVKIFVISPEAKQKLIAFGIDAARIDLFNCFTDGSNRDRERNREDFVRKYQVRPGARIVVYYTETLQDIPAYGRSYVRTLHEQIIPLMQQLKARHNVEFFVRPHPNDPKAGTPEYDDLLGGFERAGIPMVDAYPLPALLRASDLSLAHFSRVLIESVMAGTPLLSINLNNDNNCTFMNREERRIFEIASLGEFEQKVLVALSDGDTRRNHHLAQAEMRERFGGNRKNLEEIAEYIDQTAKTV